jgi:hypothetical protein
MGWSHFKAASNGAFMAPFTFQGQESHMLTASGTALFGNPIFENHRIFENKSHALHGEQPGKLQVPPAELILQQDMTASAATSSLITTDQCLSLHSQ